MNIRISKIAVAVTLFAAAMNLHAGDTSERKTLTLEGAQ